MTALDAANTWLDALAAEDWAAAWRGIDPDYRSALAGRWVARSRDHPAVRSRAEALRERLVAAEPPEDSGEVWRRWVEWSGLQFLWALEPYRPGDPGLGWVAEPRERAPVGYTRLVLIEREFAEAGWRESSIAVVPAARFYMCETDDGWLIAGVNEPPPSACA